MDAARFRIPGSSCVARPFHVPMLARETQERRAEESPPSGEARHHGADRAAENVRHLAIAQTLEIRENHGLAEDQRELLERSVYVAVEHRLEERLLRTRHYGCRC